MFLVRGTKFSFIIHFNEFLAASGRERDVQLHSEAADSLRGATKKSYITLKGQIKYITFFFFFFYITLLKTL